MKDLNLKVITDKLVLALASLRRYRVIIFIVLLVGIYSLLVFRINVLTNRQPSQDDVTSKSAAGSLSQVDPAVVSKIQQLQDNSVEIRTLFNQARDNPFQE